MLITREELQKYSGIVPNEDGLQDMYCTAAEDIISNYLGYPVTERFEDPPAVIVLTALRIATLLQTESDNNIGITSKTFGDSGTRVFTNYTNFDKYLLPLSAYKDLTI
jgi:hypothetical protein